MSATTNLATSEFLDSILYLSSDIVWKNQMEAYLYEHSDFAITTEIFIVASKGLLTFETVFQFTLSSLLASGLTPEQAQIGVDDKYTIPESLRATCTASYVRELTSKDPLTGRYSSYDEPNDYYRMLFGLPPSDTPADKFLYNTKYSDIPSDTPIHLLSSPDRYVLETRGYFDELYAQYGYPYLRHLSRRLIDPYIAREASRFSILYINTTDISEILTLAFTDTYRDCSSAINRIYYNEAFRKDNNLYDNFIAMAILFMTIQRMCSKYLEADINRDFYDLESIKYIYDAYNVPFFRSIPLEYHRRIVKNINRLLSYKGSTRVLFELFDLFDYGAMDIYEYYLLKLHRFDSEGRPIFSNNSDGTPNYAAMYDIKFGRVRLYDNPPLELQDPANHIDYDDIVLGDPFWITDEELMQTLYEDDFNYLETKYLGIQTAFDMMQIVYESSYFYKMIVDNKIPLNGTELTFSALSSPVLLFDLVIYTCALVCKKYGYEGNISTKYPFVSKVLGFNFKENLNTIRESIANNPYLRQDTYLDNLLLSMDVNSLDSVNSVLGKIKDLHSYLGNKITSRISKEEYFAYYQLRKTLLVSDIIADSYRKSNGEIAESFADLLEDLNIDLYSRLISDEIDADTELTSVLVLFETSVEELQFIELSDGVDASALIEHLFNLIYFFKSAKAELTGYNIIYTIRAKDANFFKLIDQITFIDEEVTINDRRGIEMVALIKEGYEAYLKKDQLKFLIDSLVHSEIRAELYDYYDYLTDKINNINDIIDGEKDKMPINDILMLIEEEITKKELYEFGEKLLLKSIDVELTPYSITVVDGTSPITMSVKDKLIPITANDVDNMLFNEWVSNIPVVFTDQYSEDTTFVMPDDDVIITATYRLRSAEFRYWNIKSAIDSLIADGYIIDYCDTVTGQLYLTSGFNRIIYESENILGSIDPYGNIDPTMVNLSIIEQSGDLTIVARRISEDDGSPTISYLSSGSSAWSSDESSSTIPNTTILNIVDIHVYEDNPFIIYTDSINSHIQYRNDDGSWTTYSNIDNVADGIIIDLYYFDNHYIILTSFGHLFISNDMTTWIKIESPDTTEYTNRRLAYSDFTNILMQSYGPLGTILINNDLSLTSSFWDDGIAVGFSIDDFSSVSGTFIALSSYADSNTIQRPVVTVSIDGLTWINASDMYLEYNSNLVPHQIISLNEDTVIITFNDKNIQLFSELGYYKIQVVDGSVDLSRDRVANTIKWNADSFQNVVPLVADNIAHKRFYKWSVEPQMLITGEFSTLASLIMPRNDIAVTANFTDIEYRITVSNGSANKINAIIGEEISITANDPPSSHYKFDRWLYSPDTVVLDDEHSASTKFIMVGANVSLSAQYADVEYTITVIPGTADKTAAVIGDIVNIELDKKYLEHDIDIETGTASETEGLLGEKVFIEIDKSYVAYDIIMTNGTSSRNTALTNELITVSVTLDTGYALLGWASVPEVTFEDPTSLTTTFIMPSYDVTITPEIEAAFFNITVVNGTANKTSAVMDETIEVTAEVEVGERFVSWTSVPEVTFANPTSPTTIFTMPSSNIQITAVTEMIEYPITVTNGTSVSTGTYGDIITIEVMVLPEFTRFDHWESTTPGVVFDDATSFRTTFTMPPSEVSIKAVIAEAFRFSDGTTTWQTTDGDLLEVIYTS